MVGDWNFGIFPSCAEVFMNVCAGDVRLRQRICVTWYSGIVVIGLAAGMEFLAINGTICVWFNGS